MPNTEILRIRNCIDITVILHFHLELMSKSVILKILGLKLVTLIQLKKLLISSLCVYYFEIVLECSGVKKILQKINDRSCFRSSRCCDKIFLDSFPKSFNCLIIVFFPKLVICKFVYNA